MKFSSAWSEKGKRLIVVEGYRFRFDKTLSGGGQRWRCTKNNCKAFLKFNDNGIVKDCHLLHDHPKLSENTAKRIEISNNLKKNVPESVNEQLRKQTSIEIGELNKNIGEQEIEKLRRNYYEARRKLFPRLSKTVPSNCNLKTFIGSSKIISPKKKQTLAFAKNKLKRAAKKQHIASTVTSQEEPKLKDLETCQRTEEYRHLSENGSLVQLVHIPVEVQQQDVHVIGGPQVSDIMATNTAIAGVNHMRQVSQIAQFPPYNESTPQPISHSKHSSYKKIDKEGNRHSVLTTKVAELERQLEKECHARLRLEEHIKSLQNQLCAIASRLLTLEGGNSENNFITLNSSNVIHNDEVMMTQCTSYGDSSVDEKSNKFYQTDNDNDASTELDSEMKSVIDSEFVDTKFELERLITP